VRRIHRFGDRPDLCDAVRQAVSASLDDEPPGLRAWTRRAHLRRCPECRRFEAGVQEITVPMFLNGSRRAPADLKERLAGALIRPDGLVLDPGRERGRRLAPHVGWRRRVQWAGALVPTVALGVLLPLGAFSAASGRPTHASTPCTVNVRHVPRPFG
jgi:hypothetical protein